MMVTLTATTPNPLSVICRYCRMPRGTPCRSGSFRNCRPHKVRRRDALAVAAHSDPELDRWAYGGAGPCAFHDCPGLGARHRVVDAIAGRLAAGEAEAEVAADYNLPAEAIATVQAWMIRWDGAWR